MERKFTYLNCLLIAMLFSLRSSGQAAGDYRTISSGNWSDFTTVWQVFSGGIWIAATHSPDFNDNNITVQSPHVVLFDLDATIDQVTVAPGATLTMNQGGAPVNTITLNDASGTDLLVQGTLNFGGVNFMIGSGANPTLVVDNSATMNWTSGTLQSLTLTVNPTGLMNIGNAIIIVKHLACTLINNGTINWVTASDIATPSGIDFSDATFINNGTLNEQFASDRGFSIAGGTTNSFVNNGVFNKSTSFAFFNNLVAFTNHGTINGLGSLNLTGTIVNDGILVPGNTNGSATGVLGTTLNAINAQATRLKSFIGTAGAVGGTNFDSIFVSDAGTIDISGDTLSVTALSAANTDPIGTIYTVLSAPSATISGSFKSVQLSPSLGNLSVTSTAVSVQKTSTLPLTWGLFDALAGDKVVKLTWSTLQEQNTSRFIVEYAADGKTYASIGEVDAAGNSTTERRYSFTHTGPQLSGTNFYRLQQVDLDAKSSYSLTRAVRFNTGKVVKVFAYPNPVHDLLQLTAQDTELSALLTDGSGKPLRNWRLQPGSQQVSIGNLPAGLYQLIIYQRGKQIDRQHILKF